MGKRNQSKAATVEERLNAKLNQLSQEISSWTAEVTDKVKTTLIAVDQHELVTLLNCAEAELIGYVDEDTGADAEFGETPAAKTVRELHDYLVRIQPDHECSITKDADAENGPYECAECGMTDHPTSECPSKRPEEPLWKITFSDFKQPLPPHSDTGTFGDDLRKAVCDEIAGTDIECGDISESANDETRRTGWGADITLDVIGPKDQVAKLFFELRRSYEVDGLATQCKVECPDLDSLPADIVPDEIAAREAWESTQRGDDHDAL